MDRIRKILESNPDAKLGFVVYRCTYADDEQWNCFMEYLNAQAQSALKEYNLGDLSSRLDWNVQQDPTLNDASLEQVRDKFRRWTKEGGEVNHATARFHACVMVDQICLQENLAVIKKLREEEKPLDEFDMFGLSWVYLVSQYDESSEKQDDQEASYAMVGISYLVPRVYELLEGPGWHNFADPDGGVVTP
ncbi:hypothetical protein DM02DRAFT_669142 [Periconia macrospinosa]|uniref:Uncharacterized protein n=1 Tax=Periconia macrospinosa TaxID=97972 RepID=A0A2V1E507_9PLEO|nr:hypothetical protein DM02DRAFT_669142 [Periconia macrospinosa]